MQSTSLYGVIITRTIIDISASISAIIVGIGS